MSSKRDIWALRKLVSHIDHSLEYCEGEDFDSFMGNRMLQEACVFNVLQIGELARNALSDGLIAAHQGIPWRQMCGLRNRIVHDYEGVRLKIVWDTISRDFVPLRKALTEILEELT